MWTPTHVQVTVHRARNLIPKGKHGTNDAYATIQLGKEKFQTTVQEKAENPEWHEECDMLIPDMTQCVVLNVYHRNLLGLDEFLGNVSLPLQQFQIYERPKSRWFALKNKASSSKKEKYRGELEITVAFTVKNIPEREKLQSKLEKKKVKESLDDLNKVEELSPRGVLFKNSPSKIDRRLHSLHPEVLPTVPSFELPSTGTSSPRSNSLSSSTSSLTQSETSLSRQSTGRSSTPKTKDSLTPRSTPAGSTKDIATQDNHVEESPNQKKDGLDLPDDDYFSRSNSFRQAIGRGSLRRSSGSKRGSFSERQRETSAKEEEISGFLMGGRVDAADDTESQPEVNVKSPKTSAPAKPPRRLSSETTPGLSKSTSIEEEDPDLEILDADVSEQQDVTSPQTHVGNMCTDANDNNNDKNDYRRHTLGSRRVRVTAHDIADTIAETKRLQENASQLHHLPNEYMDQFKHLSREDLIQLIVSQRQENAAMKKEKRDLEDYIDNLLVRVMDMQPLILQNPLSQARSQTFSQPATQQPPHSQGVVLEVTRYSQGPPSYPPPAYTQPNMNSNKPNAQSNRGKSPPKLIKAGPKKERKSSNPLKRLSAVFK